MKSKFFVLVILLAFFSYSCSEKPKKKPSPADLEYYKVESLRGVFPVPRSFLPISRDELLNYSHLSSSGDQKAIQEFLDLSENEPQAHFSQVFAPNGFLSVFPSRQRIPIIKAYSNAFVELIKEKAHINFLGITQIISPV